MIDAGFFVKRIEGKPDNMAGVTFSQPGNWTSWPPHEHAALAEEAYLYIEMPPPSFGIQLVYTNSTEPELATIVHEGDVVLMWP